MDGIRGVQDGTIPALNQFPQPIGRDPVMIDGLWMRLWDMPEVDMDCPQHSHSHEHASLLARGTVELYVDGRTAGVFVGPCIIRVAANTEHHFVTRTTGVVICCIHNLDHFNPDAEENT